MKKIVGLLVFMLLTGVLYSCKEDAGEEVVPSDITDLHADTQNKPGYIVLRWKTPDDQTIRYIKVTYYDYLSGCEVKKLASVYADSLLIPDTRKKFGEYHFMVQPFSSSGNAGTEQVVRTVSEPAKKQITLNGESKKVLLTGDQLYADTDDGSNLVSNLVDNDIKTIYHGDWANSTPLPHYIVIDLKKDIAAYTFSYTTRDHSNKDHPKVVNMYGSNEFDGSTYDVTKATLLKKITSGLPDGRNATYKSGNIMGDKTFRYIWFEVAETVSGNNYYALSEFSVTELGTTVYDPEAE